MTRLRALQERARDEQAERDAIRARRAQEQAEREWRRKEAEEIQRQVETEAMLREAREQQMAQREHLLAVEAQRERADFERVLRYYCHLFCLLMYLGIVVVKSLPCISQGRKPPI